MKCIMCGNDTNVRCGRCGVMPYCSKFCQKKHWKLHKKVCSTEGVKLVSPDGTAVEFDNTTFPYNAIGNCLDYWDMGCVNVGCNFC